MIIIRQIDSFEELEKLFPKISGLFQSTSYQRIFVNHFVNKENLYILGIFNNNNCIGYGLFEKQGEAVLFSGMKKVLDMQEITDYGDIVVDPEYVTSYQEIWNKIVDWFKNKNIADIQLDYVREDSATFNLFKNKATEQAIAPYIVLPQTWDLFLEGLERKDRKELKRKIKRLETVKYGYIISNASGKDMFEEFIRLHKLSNTDKEQFMTDEMQQFFLDLTTMQNQFWQPCFNFLKIDDARVASILTFENDEKILAYNSGHDPQYNFYSVGLLLHAFTIKRAINEKKKIYDFLRGQERYKFDLGGIPMKLYQVKINLKEKYREKSH